MKRGAIDFKECPNDGKRRGCRCGKCWRCGYHKHTAIHGPKVDGEPGSEPYGHEFEYEEEHQR